MTSKSSSPDQVACVKCGHSEGTYPSGMCKSNLCHCYCEFLAPDDEMNQVVAPSPSERTCKCGAPENDPVHSFSTEFQQSHQFTERIADKGAR